jgi:hypothetical protein
MHIFPEVVTIAGKERRISATEKNRKVAHLSFRGLVTPSSDLDEDMESDCDESDCDADDEKSVFAASTVSLDWTRCMTQTTRR